jgi:hypothetical protein
LLFRITLNFKRAQGRFLLDNLIENMTTQKESIKNKKIVEIMHKQMNMNYMNVIKEYIDNTKIISSGIKQFHNVEDSGLSTLPQEVKAEETQNAHNRELNKRMKTRKEIKRLNNYSYGWYENLEPKPYYYNSFDITNDISILENETNIIGYDDGVSFVNPFDFYKTVNVKDTYKTGDASTMMDSTQLTQK